MEIKYIMRPKEIILDFEDLCRKVKEGYSYSDISKMYNCSESIVARTIRDAGFSKKELDILLNWATVEDIVKEKNKRFNGGSL